MTAHDTKIAKSHDDVLEEMADALDIPTSKFEEAKSRYESIGDWLGGEVSHWLKRKTWRYCVGIMLANGTVQANNVNFDDDGYAGYDGQDFQADVAQETVR